MYTRPRSLFISVRLSLLEEVPASRSAAIDPWPRFLPRFHGLLGRVYTNRTQHAKLDDRVWTDRELEAVYKLLQILFRDLEAPLRVKLRREAGGIKILFAVRPHRFALTIALRVASHSCRRGFMIAPRNHRGR